MRDKVTTDCLNPVQLPITTRKRQQVDYYEQQMRKHAGMTYFLNRHALFYAALLEADIDVAAYTPLPYRLRYKTQLFQPDFHVLRSDSRELVFFKLNTVKFKSRRDATINFCNSTNSIYKEVLPNDIYDKEIEAENWLEIIRRLNTFEHLGLQLELQLEILQLASQHQFLTIMDIVDRSIGQKYLEMECALLHLLINGKLTSDLDITPINVCTRVALCK